MSLAYLRRGPSASYSQCRSCASQVLHIGCMPLHLIFLDLHGRQEYLVLAWPRLLGVVDDAILVHSPTRSRRQGIRRTAMFVRISSGNTSYGMISVAIEPVSIDVCSVMGMQ